MRKLASITGCTRRARARAHDKSLASFAKYSRLCGGKGRANKGRAKRNPRGCTKTKPCTKIKPGLAGFYVDAVCPGGEHVSHSGGSGPASYREIRKKAIALQKR